MNPSYYKNCVVPQCTSTSINTPNKLFIYVPNDVKIRRKWLTLARRDDAHSLSTKSRMYFCEDHFDLPNDMLNYTEVSQVRMKPGCTPSKFECQEDRRKRTCSSTERPYIVKKQRITTIAECLNELDKSCIPSSSLEDTPQTSSDFQTVEQNEPEVTCEHKVEKSVQACITQKFRSKAVQINIKTKDQASSPLKPSIISITRTVLNKEEHSDSDISLYTPSVATHSCSSSVQSLQVQSFSDCSELIAEDRRLEVDKTLLHTIGKIEKKPRIYIGVPSSCYYLIDILKAELNIPKHHILLCLNKIRLDVKFNQLTDDYGMTPAGLSKIFLKNIPLIASFMRPFIVELDRDMIKRTLPMAFRHKYYNVNRGFKHVEQYLKKSNITLVRPPSVETGVKMSKSQAKLTKQIASLRIHVERVIRRLREFYMLKPHACVNLKHVKILDEIVIIACALINLQDSLVK
ncbi:hypothetical protein SFRURICE_021599 [Spodoptera frugiperda]|nr:hypothetical protein SFRURICE_021599 [Spodoptera frugiperda]